MPTYLVKNPTKAPRVILLGGAGHLVLPGQEKPLDLPEGIAADERKAGMEVSAVEAPKSEESEGDDRFDNMTDDELRDFIEDNTSERPHPRTGRAKLLAAAREI